MPSAPSGGGTADFDADEDLAVVEEEEVVEEETLDYPLGSVFVKFFYNRVRRHSSLGNLSPEQFEERYRSSPAAKAV